MGKIAEIIEDGIAHIMREELVDIGRNIVGLDDNDKIFVAYFNTCLLFPKPQTYYVHVHNDFVCPLENKNGYELLEKKIRGGEKFSAHLSRSTKKTENHDLMLYDWGIYHFHLGTTIEEDGYIQRTANLLYAYIKDNQMYLLGIFEHGKWNDQQLIELIHKYYPWSIKSWAVDEQPEIVLSEQDRKRMRNANVNTFVIMNDGTAYLGPGWGYTAAGTSAKVRMQANDKFHEARNFEKRLLSELPNAEEFEWRMERDGGDILLVSNKNNRYKLYQWDPLRTRVEQERL